MNCLTSTGQTATWINHLSRMRLLVYTTAACVLLFCFLAIREMLSSEHQQIWVGASLSLVFASFLLSVLVSEHLQLKKVKSSLRERDERFGRLIDDGTEVLWQADKDLVLIYVSPSVEGMRGFGVHEILGRHVFESLTDAGIATILEDLKQKEYDQSAGLNINCTELVLQQRCKDGSLIWTEVLSRFERNTQQVITGYHGWFRNISPQKKAEEELLRSELALRATLEAIPDLLLEVDLQGYIHFAHIPMGSAGDFVAADLEGKSIRSFLPSGVVADSFDALKEAKSHGVSKGLVFSIPIAQRMVKFDVSIARKPGLVGVEDRFVVLARDVSHQKNAEERYRRLALSDPLTGLPNRRMLMRQLTYAVLSGFQGREFGALLFIDLDNFKTLNDTLGHRCGDALLRQVGSALRGCLGADHHVARLGGDEFAILVSGLGSQFLQAVTRAEMLGAKLLSLFDHAYQSGELAHRITPSIGITLFGERHESIEGPLKRADLAMYQAKAAGKSTWRFFDHRMQTAVSERAVLEAGLREALKCNQLELHYQAQVIQDVSKSHRVIGAEVLVRWNHPTRGMLLPAEFIPLAEETGLIVPLGQWVMEAACSQLAIWAHTPALEQLTLSVNVSVKQIQRSDFVDEVLGVLERTGVNPRRLKFEITENMQISNMDEVTERMNVLKRTGIGFSLDDFGTGYSSLSYLKGMPLEQLKIDQSFVDGIVTNSSDAAIAKMVITLARSLNLTVIAEGVETQGQREVLAAHGCNLFQGHLFSSPLICSAFEEVTIDINASVQGERPALRLVPNINSLRAIS